METINNAQTSNIHISGVNPIVRNITNSTAPVFHDIDQLNPESYAY